MASMYAWGMKPGMTADRWPLPGRTTLVKSVELAPHAMGLGPPAVELAVDRQHRERDLGEVDLVGPLPLRLGHLGPLLVGHVAQPLDDAARPRRTGSRCRPRRPVRVCTAL